MTTETPQMWDVINKMNDELAEVQEENERLKKSLEQERKEHHKNFIDLHIFQQIGQTIFSDDFDDAINGIDFSILTKAEKTRAMELWYRYSDFRNVYPIKDYTMTREELYEYLINRGEEGYEDKGYFFEDDDYLSIDLDKCCVDDIYFHDCPWDDDIIYFENLPY